MKTFKECYDEHERICGPSPKSGIDPFGNYYVSDYDRPFKKLRDAGIPEEYDTLIINLPMNPTMQYLFNNANFAARVLIELHKNSLLIAHPKGIDYFNYIYKQFHAGPAIHNYFEEDLPAAVKLFADLIKQGFFADNFDGLKTIMRSSGASDNYVQKAQLFVEFAEERKRNASMEFSNKSLATLLISQKGNPAFSDKEIGSENVRKEDNQKGCVIS